MTVKSLNVLSLVHNFTKLGVIFCIHFYRIFVSSQNLYVELQKIESLIKELQRAPLPLLLYEVTVKRQPSMNQEARTDLNL